MMGSLYITKAIKEIFKENDQVTLAELYSKVINQDTPHTITQKEIKHRIRGALYSLCKRDYIVRTEKGTYKLKT